MSKKPVAKKKPEVHVHVHVHGQPVRAGKETHVLFCLDRSGSMESVRASTISSFNEQLQTIRSNAEKGGESFVHFVTFGNDTATVEYVGKSPKEVPMLTAETYAPNGSTPMYDGVGLGLDTLLGFDRPGGNKAFLVIVLSDGEENASKRYRASEIAERVRSLERTGRWAFSYIGANQDLGKVERDLGLAKGSSNSFRFSSMGVRSLGAALADSIGTYYTSRASGQSMNSGTFGASFAANLAAEPDEEAPPAPVPAPKKP